jgi:uncharacterized RDD family membrane protein YckC
VTTPQNPARWAADPLGRHQYRYWDGAQWTDHVADDGVVGHDPVAPPSPPTQPATPQLGTPTAVTPQHQPTGQPTPSGSTPAGAPGADAPGWAAPAGVPIATGAPSPWQQAAPVASYDPTAVLGRRYGAFAIDAVICLVLFGIFFFATAETHTRAEMLRDPECHVSSRDTSQVECHNRVVVTVNDTVYEADFGLFALLSIAFTFVYFAVVEGTAGGSLGKQMTGLRVVTPEGERIGIGRSVVRWLVFAVDGPLSIYLCGIITSAVSVGHRRLGDMAAGTYVVGKADAGRPLVPRTR